MFLREKRKNEKKWILGVFSSCGLGAHSVNTPSPAALRRHGGTSDGASDADEVDNSEVYQGGRAGSSGRTGLVFVSGLLFDIDNI